MSVVNIRNVGSMKEAVAYVSGGAAKAKQAALENYIPKHLREAPEPDLDALTVELANNERGKSLHESGHRIAAIRCDANSIEDFAKFSDAAAVNHGRKVHGLSIIHSFSRDEFAPANEDHQQRVADLSYQSAKKVAPNSPCAVVVHTDSKGHDGEGAKLQSHILIANHDLETDRAIPGQGYFYKVAAINDELMRENQLSVVTREYEIAQNQVWEEHREQRDLAPFEEALFQKAWAAREDSTDMESFEKKLNDSGIELRKKEVFNTKKNTTTVGLTYKMLDETGANGRVRERRRQASRLDAGLTHERLPAHFRTTQREQGKPNRQPQNKNRRTVMVRAKTNHKSTQTSSEPPQPRKTSSVDFLKSPTKSSNSQASELKPSNLQLSDATVQTMDLISLSSMSGSMRELVPAMQENATALTNLGKNQQALNERMEKVEKKLEALSQLESLNEKLDAQSQLKTSTASSPNEKQLDSEALGATVTDSVTKAVNSAVPVAVNKAINEDLRDTATNQKIKQVDREFEARVEKFSAAHRMSLSRAEQRWNRQAMLKLAVAFTPLVIGLAVILLIPGGIGHALGVDQLTGYFAGRVVDSPTWNGTIGWLVPTLLAIGLILGGAVWVSKWVMKWYEDQR